MYPLLGPAIDTVEIVSFGNPYAYIFVPRVEATHVVVVNSRTVIRPPKQVAKGTRRHGK